MLSFHSKMDVSNNLYYCAAVIIIMVVGLQLCNDTQ